MATKTKKKSSSKKASSRKASTRKKVITPAARRGVKGDVHVDSTTARSDSDVHLGHFARVKSGKHENRYGVVDTVAEFGDDGYPKKVVLQTRDDESERLAVNYSDLERAEAGRR